jgi:hypothetical protein
LVVAKKIKLLSYRKKVTLKELQSICGSLAFCAKALPAGRAFSRLDYLRPSLEIQGGFDINTISGITSGFKSRGYES